MRIFQEQVPLRITEAYEGFISFSTDNPKSAEQMDIDLCNNWISSGKLSLEELNTVQDKVRELKTNLINSKK
jgi:hypothetical protein